MVIRVAPSADSLASREWERLSEPCTLFETRDWLSATEPLMPGEPLITAEFSDVGLESLIAWQALRSESPSPYFNVGGLMARLTGHPPLEEGGWTLNCAGMEMHSQLLAAPGVKFDAPRLRDHIRAAAATRAEPPVMCGVNFLPRHPAPGLPDALAQLGFQEIRGYQRGVLQVRGESYDDYLAGLTSDQRRKARRDRRLFAESGQRISVSRGPTAAGEDLIRLHRNNRVKYGGPSDDRELRILHAALFQGVGEDSVVFRSYREDTCTGFAMFLQGYGSLHAMCGGFEERQDKIGPYFECLYHAAIEWAGQNGIKEIDYGIGATMAKAVRGCQISDVSTWYLPAGFRLS